LYLDDSFNYILTCGCQGIRGSC